MLAFKPRLCEAFERFYGSLSWFLQYYVKPLSGFMFIVRRFIENNIF